MSLYRGRKSATVQKTCAFCMSNLHFCLPWPRRGSARIGLDRWAGPGEPRSAAGRPGTAPGRPADPGSAWIGPDRPGPPGGAARGPSGRPRSAWIGADRLGSPGGAASGPLYLPAACYIRRPRGGAVSGPGTPAADAFGGPGSAWIGPDRPGSMRAAGKPVCRSGIGVDRCGSPWIAGRGRHSPQIYWPDRPPSSEARDRRGSVRIALDRRAGPPQPPDILAGPSAVFWPPWIGVDRPWIAARLQKDLLLQVWITKGRDQQALAATLNWLR